MLGIKPRSAVCKAYPLIRLQGLESSDPEMEFTMTLKGKRQLSDPLDSTI